ncbi:MAG TPA: hypothetical protein PKO06_03015 [Candidatus Ozemobacteraceae bacterium]|nr:hypothetical protein [Candidatus Ozemobacteraceae bacterium]
MVEKAELQIMPDGRFRFVALRRGKPGLWTRGSVRRMPGVTSTGWDFLCEDLHGTLRGEVVKAALDLIWQPDPLSVERYRFDPVAALPAFESGHPAVLPAQPWVATPLDDSSEPPRTWSLWRGLLAASADLPRGTGRTVTGSTLLFLDNDRQIAGVTLFPSAIPGSPLVLLPLTADLHVSLDRQAAALNWSTPKPAPSYQSCVISGQQPEPGKAWTGETSFGGLVRSTFRFEPIGNGVSTPFSTPAVPTRTYSLVAALEQSDPTFPLPVRRLFPLSISFTDNRLWFSCPDDTGFRLAVPFELSAAGRLVINGDAQTGHLLRLADRDVAALVIRSVAGSSPGFQSRFIDLDHLWLVLDLTVQRFHPVPRSHHCRLALYLRWSS